VARNVLPVPAVPRRTCSTGSDRRQSAASEEIASHARTEALQMLIVNYKGIKPAMRVVCCDLDMPMIAAMDGSGFTWGQVVKFAMPEPATTATYGAYRKLSVVRQCEVTVVTRSRTVLV